jgi:hypothetical protein
MLERLQKRQKESHVINNIGEIFLECALEFGNDYVKYNGHFPLADNLIKIEKAKNPSFKRFLEVKILTLIYCSILIMLQNNNY